MIQIAFRSITTGDIHNWRIEPVIMGKAPATAKVFTYYSEAAAHMKARLEKEIAANRIGGEAMRRAATRKLGDLEAAPGAYQLPRFIVAQRADGGIVIEQVTYIMKRHARVYLVRGDEVVCERERPMWETFAEAKAHALELARRRVSDALIALGTAEAIRAEVEALTPNEPLRAAFEEKLRTEVGPEMAKKVKFDII